MKTNSILLISVALVGLMTASVSQAYQLSLVGVGTLQNFNYTGDSSGTNPTSSAKMDYGAGFLIDGRRSGPFNLQLGVLYVNQEQDLTSQGNTLIRHEVQVPLTLQIHLIPGLTIGAGGYYSHTIGDNTVTSDSTGVSTLQGDSYEQLKSYDVGAVGGAAFHLPLTQTCHFLADARYLTSFVNQDTSGTVTTRPAGFQFMVGLTFGMMGGRRY